MTRRRHMAWVNGMFVADNKVPNHNVGAHFGQEVFEGIRAYQTEHGTAIFRLDNHLTRFFYSLGALGMTMPYSREELICFIKETVLANGGGDLYIRPSAYCSERSSKPYPTTDEVTLVVHVEPPIPMGGTARVIISHKEKIGERHTDPYAKVSGNYLQSFYARLEAKKRGADDALLFDGRGHLAESCYSNVFCVWDRMISTPALGSILPGITRDTIMVLVEQLGYQIFECFIERQELLAADEVFLTGTAVEVTPVTHIDGRAVNGGKPGPITRALKQLYTDVVRGRLSQYDHWLTFM